MQNICPNREMQEGRNSVPRSAWDGNNWTDSGMEIVGTGQAVSGMGNGRERESDTLQRDGKAREQKLTTARVGKSRSGTKYHMVFPFPYRTVPVLPTFSRPDFYPTYP